MLTKMISRIFNRMFNKRYYVISLVTYIIFIATSLILFFLFFGSSILGFLKQIQLQDLANIDSSVILNSIFTSIPLIVIFFLIIMYLLSVVYVFIIDKLNNKNNNIFDGIGKIFLRALMFFLGANIIFSIFSVIIVLTSFLTYIPFVGVVLWWILFFILKIFLGLFLVLFLGNISCSKGFLISFKNALKNIFKLKIIGYFLIFILINFALSGIYYLIGLIPIGGIILSIFLYPLILIYLSSVILEISKI